MDFWGEVVKAHDVATTGENSERLTDRMITQELYVMIQEGLEYSYVTNGLASTLL